MPAHQRRRRRLLLLSASCLVLFGVVIDATEVLFDQGRVTYVIFGTLIFVLGALGLLWARLDRNRVEESVWEADPE